MEGIHKNISMAEYQLDPCPEPSATRSAIKSLIYETPERTAHNHPRLNPNYKEEDGDKKFDLGTAAHSLFLEGLDCCCIVDADDWRKKKAKEQRDLARKEGKTPLLRHQYNEVHAMVMAARFALGHNPNIPVIDVVTEGLSEATVIWQEGNTWLRCRTDWFNNEGFEHIILDYKTTGVPGGPEMFNRAIIQHGLDIQEALYRRGVKKVTGIDHTFIFMIQETFPPYAVFFMALPPDYQEMGKQKVEAGIRLWNHCMTHKQWPGYSQQIYYPDPQPWAMAQWEERRFSLELISQGEI